MRSRSRERFSNTDALNYMMKTLAHAVLILALVLAGGCSTLHSLRSFHLSSLYFWKSKPKPEAELHPATAVEKEYHDRWVDKRMHELMAAGTAKTETEARAMASEEFEKLYPFIHPKTAEATR